MIDAMARLYLRSFLSRERLVHRLFPLGIGASLAAAMMLPLAAVLLVLVVLLFWTMHLDAEIHDTLLPEEAHLDAIAYRGNYYFVLAAMALLGGAHLALPAAGYDELLAPERLSLAVALFAFATVHTAVRSVELAEIGEHFLATRRLEGGHRVVMRSRFSRWLTSGRVLWFLRRRRDDR